MSSSRAGWFRSSRFPYAPERKHTLCDASKEQLFALRDHLGFDKNVIVQTASHGPDNGALVDALRASNNNARGVATVNRKITDAELQDMHAAGVRGTRFIFVRRLTAFTPREMLLEIAHRIAPLGWHVVVYFQAQDLPELYERSCGGVASAAAQSSRLTPCRGRSIPSWASRWT